MMPIKLAGKKLGCGHYIHKESNFIYTGFTVFDNDFNLFTNLRF